MNKTMTIEGTTCGHCTASVEKALRAVKGVSDVKVDLAAKTAIITADDGVGDDTLSQAVEETGFDVVSIQ